LRSVLAQGSVDYATSSGRLSGERARIDFNELGRILGAHIEGEPELSVRLRTDGAVPPLSDVIDLTLSGTGPLQIDYEGAKKMRFDLGGPAELLIPERQARLVALGGMRGEADTGLASGRLEAWQQVRAELERAALETEALALDITRAGDGSLLLGFSSQTLTLLSGTQPDGQAFELHARKGIRGEHSQDGTVLHEAREVDMWVAGENRFLASADSVSDFNARALTLSAQGNVFFENALARAFGERVQIDSKTAGSLYGSDVGPARIEFKDGFLAAESIRFESVEATEHLTGEGRASGQLAAGGTTYAIEAESLVLEREAARFSLRAFEDITASAQTEAGRLYLTCSELHIDQSGDEDPSLRARGEVDFEFEDPSLQSSGSGEELTLEPDGQIRLVPKEGERVLARGEWSDREVRFDLSASSCEFSAENLRAADPDIQIEGVTVPLTADSGAPASSLDGGSIRVIAGSMDCDFESILFGDGVFIGRYEGEAQTWSIDAKEVLLQGEPSSDPGVAVRHLSAWGGFTARFVGGVQAAGERMDIHRDEGQVSISGAPAQVVFPGVIWESQSIEWDLNTGAVSSVQGKVRFQQSRSQDQIMQDSWTLDYEAMHPESDEDSTVQVVRDPVFRQGDHVARAAWAVLWINRQEWSRLNRGIFAPGGSTLRKEDPAETVQKPDDTGPQMPSIFGALQFSGYSQLISELYLDGNIEFLVEGRRRGQADAFYLDLVDGHGWLKDADLLLEAALGRKTQKYRIHADWLRHSRDGSLAADSAVLTTCDFEEPHFVIECGELSVTPEVTSSGESNWRVRLTKNAIRFRSGLAIPLPRISFPMNEKYQVPPEQIAVFGVQPLSAGSDSKFGAFVQTSVIGDIGWFARGFTRMLKKLNLKGVLPSIPKVPGVPGIDWPQAPEGKAKVSASYLDSRGGLLDLDLRAAAPGLFRFQADTAVVYDTGEDEGLLQVPEEDRDEFRLWARGQSRFTIDESEWIDFVYSWQSDPSVQSEFFESDYLRFEQRETYLHWRQAQGQTYMSAVVSPRTDDFRSEVQELPSLGYYRGRTEVARIGTLPLLYTTDSGLAYLNRVEGDFEPPFQDGQGEQDTLRLDTDHRFETPFETGIAGLKLAPFVEGRLTVWDEGSGSDGAPIRAAALVGLELATAFWREFRDGSRHEVTTSLEGRTDALLEQDGTPPARFDSVEDSLEGNIADFRVRSLWESREKQHALDVEVALSYADDVPADQPDGFLPVEVNSNWYNRFRSTLIGIYHDGRYDSQTGNTLYSRLFFGLEPTPRMGFGAGHTRGLDTDAGTSFEAVTLAARYQLTNRYEIEGEQSISTQENDQLSTEVVLRRYGHDFIVDLKYRFRAGEGSGHSYSIDVIPLVLWKKPRFPFIDRWREDS
jgi:hypothetical protein